MTDPIPQFDDPILKATLRRAAAGAPGAADATLRAAVEQLVQRETRAQSSPPALPRAPWPRARWFAAVAAALLLIAGTAVILYQRHHHAAEQAEYLAANLPLFNAMIQAQSTPDAVAPDNQPLPIDDRERLRQTLATKLGRPVPVPDWHEKGWRLAAATVGRIGAHPAAELRYENAGRKLLFVSLPADAYVGHEGEEPEPYEYSVSGHAIAGFVRDHGLHCIIADPGVSPREVAGLKVE